MKKLLVVAFVLLTGLACQRQQQIVAVNAVVQVANGILPTLVEAFKQEGLEKIRSAKTENEARGLLAAVEAKWEPVWVSWRSLEVAHSAWSDAVQRGRAVPNDIIQSAYCGLIKVLPVKLPVLPIVPFVCGE